MKLRRLSHHQKRLLTAALLSGAASAGELAIWARINVHTVYDIAKVFSTNNKLLVAKQYVQMWKY